jgi:hypothetical protein
MKKFVLIQKKMSLVKLTKIPIRVQSNEKFEIAKGGIISESFSLWLKSPQEKMLRLVIWHPFWEISAKVKNFLRLSHL